MKASVFSGCVTELCQVFFRQAIVVSYLIACLSGTLTLLASTSASANFPLFITPLEDKTAVVGETLHVRVVPGDADGHVPGLRLLDPPADSEFPDNLDGTRTFIWTPTLSDVGIRLLTFEAQDAIDNSLTNIQQLRIDVVPVSDSGANLAPTINSLDDQRIVLGSQFDFRVIPVDPEGIVPALRVAPVPPGASFDDNRDGTRQFRWTPSAMGPGTVRLRFTATDADNTSLASSESITLQVYDAEGRILPGVLESPPDIGYPTGNRPPVFNPLDDQRAALGQAFDFVVRPVDVDGTVPGLAIDRLPTGATFSDNMDGSRSFRWRPLPIDLGETYLTFQAIDAVDPTIRTQKTIQLTVYRDPENPVNFEPYINGIRNPLIRAGDTLNQQVEPVDPDFIVPSLQVVNPPPGSEFVDNGNGTRTLIWPTQRDAIGDTSVTFLAIDADDPTAQSQRTITISVVDPATLQRSGDRLRSLATQHDLSIGFAAALNSSSLADNQLYLDTAAEEFNIVTPENSHKMGWIHPHRGSYRFDDADALADYAEANNMLLHGHPLVWFAQLPGWVQTLNPVDAEEVMLEHITALAGRYRSRVAIWDVVNEALEDDGRLRESIWYQGMGESYISKAFAATRAVDPAAQLIYNDYDVAWENPKSDAMFQLLKRELAAGTPIDGVGFQMHLRSDFNDFDSVTRNLQRFADLGLDIYITEFDVSLDAPATLQTQAEIYSRSLEVCLAQSRCKSMQAWGFTDRYSWRSANTPLLLDDRYQPKPSYTAWQRTLEEFTR